MEERLIRKIIVQPSPHGRKMVNLAVVLESLRAMARDSEPSLHSKGIFLVEINEDTLTPDTTIVFIMEGEWGELKIQYTPGQAAIGNFRRIFSQMMTRTGNDPSSILKCTEGAFVRLLQKLPENLRDAMAGLMEETVYETVDALVGKQITGDLKRKPWRDHIADKHAKLSLKRMGAQRGKVSEPGEFLKKLSQAAEKVNGALTRQRIAEEMGIPLQSFDRQVKKNGFTWPQLLDFLTRSIPKT